MEKPNEAVESSLIFVNGRKDDCMIRFMTVYQEGLILDAEFTPFAQPAEKEWHLGEKGAIKMIVAHKGVWQEVIIDYNLSEGYLYITAVTASFLSKSVMMSIARRFYIRRGEAVQFLSARALLHHTEAQPERCLLIDIPVL
ncbi:hypothetical protein RRU94_10695 [Domibacillus sp. DTU_2020_1001157_1_SI_ALB_TIR_016]|uniref:hypothetical protein n=1 Tax=Domibacillus sp. DTU_2020_1001157_1_SI_ALB_TIR_016 TaxID=3077789 RepID=UPI0028F085E2|nr:hypothetical protein [Domibacillus sp. DTU_2020_1001157_1_SI_ALB_TIR_016]WNS81267.1 hypothetical protein RRU94_10695 [Domibacillus sp. DTU_2020_1001157_1_SI_ALB_TIR_016]